MTCLWNMVSIWFGAQERIGHADLLLEQTMMQSFKSQGGLIRGSKFEESVRVVWAFIEYASMSQHTFG